MGQNSAMRIAAEFALLLALGIFLGFTGAYDTAREPVLARYAFWLVTVIAGGALGIAVEARLRGAIAHPWARAAAAAAVMTPPVAFLVFGAMVWLLGHEHAISPGFLLSLVLPVFVISFAAMALRMLVRRPAKRVVETQTIFAPPLPDAEAKFRSRLSVKRRAAKLLALEAYDHYVRVHTDAGEELLNLRFADAIEELSGAQGFRVHRSWWVSAPAIKAARWQRSSGEVQLEGGLTAPVSRRGASVLRAAGWL